MGRFDFEGDYERDLAHYLQMDAEELRDYAGRLLEAGDLETFYRVILGNKAYMQATFTQIQDNSIYHKVLQQAIQNFDNPLSEDDLYVLTLLWGVHHLYEYKARGIGYLRADIETLVWLGHKIEVLNMAHWGIGSDYNKSPAAVAFAESGDMATALQLLDGIESSDHRDNGLAQIVTHMLKIGNFQQSIHLAKQIHLPQKQAQAFGEIAYYAAKIDLSIAKQALKLGMKAAQQIKEWERDHLHVREIRKFQLRSFVISGRLTDALETANAFEYKEYRNESLQEVAQWLYAIGDTRYMNVCNALLGFVRRTDDTEERARGLMMVLENYLEFQFEDTDIHAILGELRDAIEKVESFFLRLRLLHSCASLLAKYDYFQQAMDCTRAINHDIYITDTLQPVLYEMALAGKSKEAIEIAYEFDGLARSLCLSQIALALAKTGDYEKAESTLSASVEHHRLHDKFDLGNDTSPFVAVVKLLAQSGRLEDALELVKTGIEVDLRYSYSDDEYVTSRKGWDREKIAYALVESGDFNGALSLAEEFRRDIDQNQLMRDIVISHAEQGNFDEAKAMLEQMNQNYYVNKARSALGVQYTKHGQLEQAYKIAKQLEKRVNASKAQYHVDIYIAIAEDLAQKGESEKALAIVREFEYSQHRAEGLVAIAIVAQVSVPDILYEALENAKAIEDEKDRRNTIKKVVIGFYETGHGEAAIEIARSFRDHRDHFCRAVLLTHVAALYGRDGKSEFEALLQEATDKVHDHILRAIVEILCTYGLTDEAAQIAIRIEKQNNEFNRLFAREYVAYSYAKHHRYREAFEMLREHKLSKENSNSILTGQWFLYTMAAWKLPLEIVLDVMRITSWEIPQWKQVFTELGGQ